MKFAPEETELFRVRHQFEWHWVMIKCGAIPLLIQVVIFAVLLLLAAGNGGAAWILFTLHAVWLLTSLSDISAHMSAMRYAGSRIRELEATMSVRDVMGS